MSHFMAQRNPPVRSAQAQAPAQVANSSSNHRIRTPDVIYERPPKLAVFLIAVRSSRMAQSEQSPRCNKLSVIGPKRTKVDLSRLTVCPLMTQVRHWLCIAAMVLMPVSAPIEVLI